MGRLFYAVFLIALFVAAALCTWPQIAGLQDTVPFAQVVSARGAGAAVAAALAVLLLILAALIRPARGLLSGLIIILVLYAVANAGILFVRAATTDTSETSAAAITVGSWNTRGNAVSPDEIAGFARDNDVDVLSLPETSRPRAIQVAERIRSAGGPLMTVYSTSYRANNATHTTSMLLAASLGDYSVSRIYGDTTLVPSLVATPAVKTQPVFVAAHTTAPRPTNMSDWQNDLDWVTSLCDLPNVIVAGDLNATVDHLSPDLGCSDAALTAGNAALGTWHTSLPPFFGAPIDHILYSSGWEATRMTVDLDKDTSGSDHRPIIARLIPAR